MAGAIRAGRLEGAEEGWSPHSPASKRPTPSSGRERAGGAGDKAAAAAAGGAGCVAVGAVGSPRAAAAAAASPRAAAARPPPPPAPPAALKTFRADDGLVLYAPSPADALAEAASNKDSQVYFGESRRGGVLWVAAAARGGGARAGAGGRAPGAGARSLARCARPPSGPL
jgi:pyruvate dehydrogenase E2 component (dihydrolipoamide acetyltransferase)